MKQKHTFYRRKPTNNENKSLRSAPLTKIILCLRRQACSSFRDFVGVFDSLSSGHVDSVRSRSVCGDGDTNSLWDTHAARVNSQGVHSAWVNSWGHADSYRYV